MVNNPHLPTHVSIPSLTVTTLQPCHPIIKELVSKDEGRDERDSIYRIPSFDSISTNNNRTLLCHL